MRRITLYSLGVSLLLFILLPLLGGSIVEAKKLPEDAKSTLSGTYAFSVFRACVQVPEGEFNMDLQQQVDPQLRTSVLTGTITYNGDGTGTQEHTFRNMFFTNDEAFQRVPGRSGLTMCDVTYQVDATGSSFTQENTCDGFSNRSGGGTANFTLTNLLSEGRISSDGRTLVLFGTGVDIEKFTFFINPTRIFDRICTFSGTAVSQ